MDSSFLWPQAGIWTLIRKDSLIHPTYPNLTSNLMKHPAYWLHLFKKKHTNTFRCIDKEHKNVWKNFKWASKQTASNINSSVAISTWHSTCDSASASAGVFHYLSGLWKWIWWAIMMTAGDSSTIDLRNPLRTMRISTPICIRVTAILRQILLTGGLRPSLHDRQKHSIHVIYTTNNYTLLAHYLRVNWAGL